jgi:hypothetical protein
MESDNYCREIEAYLCRRNDGHLVRLVGPSFEIVTGWLAMGVPFKVACRGIDRYFERYYAKGPRRRPVRLEFCDADVLDAFDEWKRAVGVGMAGTPAGDVSKGPAAASADGGTASKPGHSLRAHLDRAVTRLTDLQTRGNVPPGLEGVVEQLLVDLGGEREASRNLRGDARATYLRTLEARDAGLMDAARRAVAAEEMARLSRDAAEELSAYKGRMPDEAYARALAAALDRLVRDYWKLPVITYGSGL